jgi:hypothetical protein
MYSLLISDYLHEDCQASAVILAEVPQDQYAKNPDLQACLPYPTFLMYPLAPPSSTMIKISGTEGGVDPKWRRDPSTEIQRITRTMDAFVHFVFKESGETILIGDIQGDLIIIPGLIHTLLTFMYIHRLYLPSYPSK